MKFTKTWKRFWTLNRHHAAGFTLVELIVVIAILAILAGIAVPAYSGYIEKANEAADQTLLSAVNTAYAAACLENGEDMVTLSTYPRMPLNADKTINMAGVTPYGESFETYFEGNSASAFKTFTALYFNKATGVFEADAPVAYTYAGSTVNVSKATIELMKNSNWTAEGLGAEGIVDKLGLIDGAAKMIIDGEEDGLYDFVALMGGDAFLNDFAATMGIEGIEGEEDKLWAIHAVLQGEGKSEAEVNQMLVNNAVLFAAQNASTQKTEDVMALLKAEDVVSQIDNADSVDKLSQSALLYGMYTAYAHSTGDADLIAKTEQPMQILSALENDEEARKNFQAYLDTDQATTDLEAYMAALGTVSDAANDTTAAQNVLNKGFNDPELLALIQTAMGQGQ